MSDNDEAQQGGWVVYSFDNGQYAISLHATAADAARSAARCGYGSVAWWPFGTDLDDAIREWVKPLNPTTTPPPATPATRED